MEGTQESRRIFLLAVRDALELLLHDTELQENGFTYYYVVDFAAIYAYMHKTPDTPFIRIPGESDERMFALYQMALGTLFTQYPRPLVLIPPYSAEVNNQIRYLTTIHGLAALDVRVLYREKLSRLITNSETFKEFNRLRLDKHAQPIDEQLRRAALEVGKEYFPELYATLSFMSSHGREALQNLFRNGILRDADELIPQCRDIDYFGTRTDEWYRRINARRGGKRAYQSRSDAMACNYVETANERLNPERKIAVFVSPSRSVEASLRERSLIVPDGDQPLHAARNLTYCRLAFVSRNDKSAIKKSLETVIPLLELHESPIPVEWRERWEEAQRDWTRCENLLSVRELGAEMPTTKIEGLDERFLDILFQLHLAATENRDDITSAIVEKFSDLYRETAELNKLIPSNHTVERLRSTMVKERARGVLGLFSGLQDELSLGICFTDKDVIRLAGTLQDLAKGNYSEAEIFELRTHILEAASLPTATAEHHLLAGYILALDRRYDSALAQVNESLESAGDADRKELLFVAGVIHRKLYHAKEACEFLERALEVAPDDPRFNLEYAKALWMKWREDPDQEIRHAHLHHALERLRAAARAPQPALEGGVNAQIENVAAFLLTELALTDKEHQVEHLNEAEKHMERLRLLLPEGQWPGRFLDSEAHRLYVKAQSLAGDRYEEKKNLLERATLYGDKGMQKGEDAGPEPDIRQQHRKQIADALGELTLAEAS